MTIELIKMNCVFITKPDARSLSQETFEPNSPKYSPDLNPDEFLNHDMKQYALSRRRAAGRENMAANVRSYLWSAQKQPDIARKLSHAHSVHYAME